MEKNILKCIYCGNAASVENFDLDKNNLGFWCNECDGYNYYHDNTSRHKFTLILEDKSKTDTCVYEVPIKLDKRISPLRYPGGKSKICEYIYSKIQDLNKDTFVEAFSGGGSVGLALLKSNVINNLILNDLDYGIYALFTLIKENPNVLIEKIKNYEPNHQDFFDYQKKIFDKYKDCSMLESAWSLLLVNRLAYSGIYKANPLGGRRGTQNSLLQRWNPDGLINRINKIHSISEHITVLNLDAKSLIEEVYWKPNTTIFVDPPYFNKGKDLYSCYYNEEDHIELSLLLDSLHQGCPGADMILTYDNNKFIEEIYKYPSIEKVNRVYSI